MNVSFYVGVPDSVKCLGQAPVGDKVVEIDLQDLIRAGVQSSSEHVGESVKLFVMFDNNHENKGDRQYDANFSDDYAGSDSVG